jgi:hypothetical protein
VLAGAEEREALAEAAMSVREADRSRKIRGDRDQERVIYLHAIKKVGGYVHAIKKFADTCVP